MALWESLANGERESHFALSDEQREELDRRWSEHLADPDSAIPWTVVEQRLKAAD